MTIADSEYKMQSLMVVMMINILSVQFVNYIKKTIRLIQTVASNHYPITKVNFEVQISTCGI